VKKKKKWIDSKKDKKKKNAEKILKDIDGIVVPSGFGSRGIEGKIAACRYARENNVPYLGLGLGMQIAAIEFARNVLGDAGLLVFDETAEMSLPMRLGAHPCKIKDNTLLSRIYNCGEVSERHRHKYEFDKKHVEIFENHGFIISGTSPHDSFVEAIEIPANDFFISVLFQPEFKSRPNKAHPLFSEFVSYCSAKGEGLSNAFVLP
jgi:CTP synthase